MTAFATWLYELVKSVFTAVWDFVADAFINIFDLLLTAILAVLTAIPVPSFMSSGLSGAMGQISGDVWYFASHFRLGECLAILGAAVLFRLTRKALTLFQW
jgi:hypothetical protein